MNKQIDQEIRDGKAIYTSEVLCEAGDNWGERLLLEVIP